MKLEEDDLDSYSAEPLTPDELKHVRRVIKADDHARWLWAALRRLAVWVAAVVGGLYMGKQALIDFFTGKH
jgi:hypothetical protein